jgi:hypothetical protein
MSYDRWMHWLALVLLAAAIALAYVQLPFPTLYVQASLWAAVLWWITVGWVPWALRRQIPRSPQAAVVRGSWRIAASCALAWNWVVATAILDAEFRAHPATVPTIAVGQLVVAASLVAYLWLATRRPRDSAEGEVSNTHVTPG